MQIQEVTDEKYRAQWDKLAGHPLQSWEWGEFREKTGVKVVRYGVFANEKLTDVVQVTVHSIPHTPWTVGYFPKGNKQLNNQTREILGEIAKKYRCIYIKCEPKLEISTQYTVNSTQLRKLGFLAGRALFTKYNLVLDVTPSEDGLLKNMKQKTRYNIKVAQKRGVTVAIDDSPAAFQRYLELTAETTKRQGFYAHTPQYHSTMWRVLGNSQISNDKFSNNFLVRKYSINDE